MKKGILRKVICLAISLVLLAGMTACGGGGDEPAGEKGGLSISIVQKGYGVDWLKAMEKPFEEQTGIAVDITVKTGNMAQSAFDNELESLSSSTDLFFTMRPWFAQDVYKGRITAKGKAYDCLYADISDVWNSKVDEGSNLTIKDKMAQTYVDALNIEGKYYNLPWAGGVFGLVRNVNVWDKLNLTDSDIPYTTDELFALCDRIKDQTAPFIYSLEDEYYIGWSPIFFGQYEGVENVKNFMDGKDPDGNVSKHIYTYDGQLEAMKIIKTLVDDANGYQHKLSTSIDFTSMQGQFLNGQALFSINGSWLENEMGANFSKANVDMLKTPVISSIVNKLSFKNLGKKEADAKLVEIIKYVDAIDAGENPSKPSGITDKDIEIVTEARHYSYVASGVDHRAYIPAYSKNIDNAKEFLKFMYSDKGLNIYYETLKGAMLPATPVNGFTNKNLSLSNFRVSVNKAQEEGFVYDREPKTRYFALNKISTCFENGGDPFVILRNSVQTASAVIKMNNDEVQSKWNDISSSLGVK